MKTKNLLLIASLFIMIFKSFGQTVSLGQGASTSGSGNTNIGANVGAGTTGNFNTNVGFNSFSNATLLAQFNVGIGANSLQYNNANSQVAIGNGSLSGSLANPVTGGFNVAVGTSALMVNTSGNLNVAVGAGSLSANTTGSGNVAIGEESLLTNTIGNDNIAIGSNALQNNISGINNISIGKQIGGPVSSNDNIFIGNGSAQLLSQGNGNIFFGWQPIGTAVLNNTIIVSTNTFGTGLERFRIDSSGRMGLGTNSPLSKFSVNGNVAIGAIYSGTNAAPSNGLLVQGSVGIGTVAPNNKVEINSGVTGTATGTSGLRFTNLKSTNTNLLASNGKVLTVNTTGDVVLTSDVGSTNVVGSANVLVTGTAATGYTISSPYQTLSQTGNTITLLNGGSFNLPSMNDTSIFQNNGIINQATTTGLNRIVDMNDRNIWFNSSTSPTNGRIYIGNNSNYPTTTGDYRLYVEGGILTEKVKVALRLTANWADYVFANDYKLTPLNEVESFINKNNHLPGIESADQLVKNGLDLADMQAKQMAKIEELTLYAIEQQKQIEELKALVKMLLENNK